MGTEISHFWPWGAEKIGFKESNPISKNMAKLNFPPIQFSLSVLRNETPCTFEYPSTIRNPWWWEIRDLEVEDANTYFIVSCALTTAAPSLLPVTWSCFGYGVTLFKLNFLSPPSSKRKNFSAHQKAEDLRISKLTLLLFLVPFLGELWPLKTWETFFWDTL